MKRLIIFIFTFLFISYPSESYSQTLGFKIVDGRKKIKIPFELHNNLIVIPVVLNGVLPLKFVLDTGVRTAILTDKDFTDILNLNYSKKYTITGVGSDRKVNAYIANNVSLKLSGIEGKGHALLVLEEDLLELKNYLGVDVHGILGYELFSRFIIKINYSTKMLTLSEPVNFRLPNSYDKVAMTVEDTKPYIFATVVQEDDSEVRVKLMVDSGASHSLFLDLQSHDCLVLPEKYIHSYVGRGLSGPIEGFVGRIKELKIGNYQIEDVISNYPEDSDYYDSIKFTLSDRNGTLGGEILTRFNVIFNFPEQEFYFKKNRFFKKDFVYNLSGLVVKAKGPNLNVYEISEVRKNSAGAEAGILPGDMIIGINGHNYRDLDLEEIIGFLNLKPNKKVSLVIQREDKVINKQFRLRNLI